MAKLRIGMRVRKMANSPSALLVAMAPVGSEGVIVGAYCPDPSLVNAGADWLIRYDNVPPSHRRKDGLYCAFSWQLAPLTPPNIADWASQKVKQVTKPEPIVPVPEKAKSA